MTRKKKAEPPPPPPNPEQYVLVNTKEGYHWRRKRGSIKPAVLNTVFKQNVKNIKIASPAAKRIAAAINPYLHGLQTGRLASRLTGKLLRAINETGTTDMSFLKNFDLQEDHPLDQLLRGPFTITQSKKEVMINFSAGEDTVKRHNRLVTNYFFDLVLLYGDPAKDKGLKTRNSSSPLYSFKPAGKTNCVLSAELPKNNDPWILFLKVSCLEGNEMAFHPKHYGMKVVEAGGRKGKAGSVLYFSLSPEAIK